VAYTTGYGAVMPAYTQPMMSAGNSELVNETSVHTDACAEEYVNTDYTVATDDYYSAAESYVDVLDDGAVESTVDTCLDEDELADKLVSPHTIHSCHILTYTNVMYYISTYYAPITILTVQ